MKGLILAFVWPIAAGATSHDFAACVSYLDALAEETLVRRPVSEVPKHLRRHFDGAAKVMLIGADPFRADQVYFITSADLTRENGVSPMHLRLTRIDDDVRRKVEAGDWGRPQILVARRRHPPRAVGAALTGDDVHGLKVGDVIERFGVYFVLHRALSGARASGRQFEAYRFKQMPCVGVRANQTATLVAGECTWVGEAVIGRRADVIAVDFDGVPRTRLDLMP